MGNNQRWFCNRDEASIDILSEQHFLDPRRSHQQPRRSLVKPQARNPKLAMKNPLDYKPKEIDRGCSPDKETSKLN
jgi:hypothetical protein